METEEVIIKKRNCIKLSLRPGLEKRIRERAEKEDFLSPQEWIRHIIVKALENGGGVIA